MENTGRSELKGSLMLRDWESVVSLLRAQSKEDNTVKKKTVFFTLRYELEKAKSFKDESYALKSFS